MAQINGATFILFITNCTMHSSLSAPHTLSLTSPGDNGAALPPKDSTTTVIAVVVVILLLVIVGAAVYVKTSSGGGSGANEEGVVAFDNPAYAPAAATVVAGTLSQKGLLLLINTWMLQWKRDTCCAITIVRIHGCYSVPGCCPCCSCWR